MTHTFTTEISLTISFNYFYSVAEETVWLEKIRLTMLWLKVNVYGVEDLEYSYYKKLVQKILAQKHVNTREMS